MSADKDKRGGFGGYEFAWFRITVVVACLGYSTGKFLLWLHL